MSPMTDEEIYAVLAEEMPQQFAKAYAKDISDTTVLLVFTDWLHENGIEPEPVISAFKELNEQRIRREQMEIVSGDSLEHEGLRVLTLTTDTPSIPTVEVPISTPHGQGKAVVEVPADEPSRIRGVSYPPDWYKGQKLHYQTWEAFQRAGHFTIDERDVLSRAQRLASQDESQVPWVGLEGELFYPARQATKGLWMDNPPEYLQRELEREFPDSDFITLYTDGGGLQSDAEPAFVLDGKLLYQLVRDGAHGAETDCPLIEPLDRRDPRGNEQEPVNDEDTLWGEYPHERCRFCEAELGEMHGVVYVGEGGEFVYALVPDERDDE